MRITHAIGTVLLAAASPALPEDNEPAANPPVDANLFVYRDYAEPTAWAPTVKIDGKKLVAIGQNQYTAVRLEQGEHDIQLAWPIFSGQNGKKGRITIAEGRVLYLEVVGTSRVSGGGYGYTEFLMGSGFRGHEDASTAITECCKFKPAKL
jgi:hypothetical protein